MNVDGNWDEQLIRNNFLQEDVNQILQIPKATRRVSDSIIWRFDKKGMFSVKSAYKAGLDSLNSDLESPSDKSKNYKWWKAFWKAKVPEKIKITVWKIFHDIVPSLVNLKKKGIDNEAWCGLCKLHLESTTHIVWLCSFARKIWRRILPSSNLVFDPQWRPADCLWGIINENPELIERILITVWHLWINRNNRVNNAINPDLQSSLEKILAWENEFTSVHSLSTSDVNSSNSRAEAISWSPPCEGTLKLNVDAASIPGNQSAGLGWVLRDCGKRVLLAGCKVVKNSPSIKFLEAQAIYEGLKSMGEIFSDPVLVESDCLEVIKLLNKEDLDLTEVELPISQALNFADQLDISGFLHVRRLCNTLAHSLASRASNLGLSGSWTGSYPQWLCEVLEEV